MKKKLKKKKAWRPRGGRCCGGKKVPQGASVLCVPFQGRSDLPTFTLPFIEKLKPHSIFLHHFDDTFPPISSQVDCAPFAALVRRLYPEMTVIIPEFGGQLPYYLIGISAFLCYIEMPNNS